MTMGEAGKNGVRTYDLKECQEILDTFFSHGHKELDTARVYAEGTTEPVRDLSASHARSATGDTCTAAGEARSEGRDSRYEVRVTAAWLVHFVADLRLAVVALLRVYPVNAGDHAPAKLRATFETSLKLLAPLKVRVLYLHAPDRSVPFEDTVREVNELYKQGLL